jgi:hypothetical protein
VFAWFRDGLPGAGWTLTSRSFCKLRMLTFTKANRIATLQMQAGSFGTNNVRITVALAVRSTVSAPARRPLKDGAVRRTRAVCRIPARTESALR